MKRIISFIICAALMLSVFSGIPAYAHNDITESETTTEKIDPIQLQDNNYEKAKAVIAEGFKTQEWVDITEFGLSYREYAILLYEIMAENKYFYYKYEISGTKELMNYSRAYTYKSESEIKRMQKEFDTAYQKFLDSIDPSWSDLQKIAYVFDTIKIKTYKADDLQSHNNAYGIFVENTGDCEASSQAFATVMNDLGIKNSFAIYIPKYGSKPGHVWNQVCVKGKWYNVDCTASNQKNFLPDHCSHEYFMVSDEACQDDFHHKYTARHKCTDTKYDDALWQVVHKPFVMYGNFMIFPSGFGYIRAYNIKTEQLHYLTNKRMPDHWYVYSRPVEDNEKYPYEIYKNGYVPMSVCMKGDYIYFNTTEKVFRYNIDTQKTTFVCKIDRKKYKDLSLFGIELSDTRIYGYLGKTIDDISGTYYLTDIP